MEKILKKKEKILDQVAFNHSDVKTVSGFEKAGFGFYSMELL